MNERSERTISVTDVVVAIVPAKDREDSVAATITALRRLDVVDRVLVVDDGSGDATADAARAAGAEVLRLPHNRGKGAAVVAAVAASPEADVYLLIDADLASTAAAAGRLLDPVLAGEADLTIGVLPPAEGRGGFGFVKRLAADGVRRACGAEVTAPLSGQRAVRARFLRDIGAADRFGLEVAMTIDVVRAGGRLVEVEVPMDHRHTGRSLAGFAHRGRQGVDILRALWPRLTTAARRTTLIAVAVVLAVGALLVAGTRTVPGSNPLVTAGAVDRVLIIGVPHLSLDDLDDGELPNLDRLIESGALAASSVRTGSSRPSDVEAYATIGAGVRVEVTTRTVGADVALPASAPVEGGTAAEAVARRFDLGQPPEGDILVPAMATAVRNAGDDLSSEPGALGQALRDAGFRTAVVTNADEVAIDGNGVLHRPAALAVVDSVGAVSTGSVLAEQLVIPDTRAPFGVRANLEAVASATEAALLDAAVVVVDTGDLSRAAAYAAFSSNAAAEVARVSALQRVDDLIGRLLPQVDEHTLVLVVGVTPPTRDWALAPIVAAGAGIPAGSSVHSASTKRRGLIAITDLAPTVLDALGADIPDGMIGQPLRQRDAAPDLHALQSMNENAGSREGVYYPMAVTFIVVQALVYLLAIVVLSQDAARRAAPALRLLVLTFAAWPLATFLERAVPGVAALGAVRQGLVWVIALVVAVLAARAQRHPLAPLSWIAGATVAFLVADVATGARLQLSSVLGYSPHTAARYTGFGNTAFAVLAACAVVAATIHVEFAPRRREAVLTAAGIFAVVLVADVWPTLGADVGGVLTMVPVFGLTLAVLYGRRLSWRWVALAAGVTVVVLAVLIGIDLTRAPEARTHLGRFVSGVGGDDSTFLTTISRKWSTNVSLFGRTIWTWMVPIMAAFVVYVLVIARGWQRLLPARSAARAGVVGTLFAGIVGWLVNDSGVVVSALVFVYLGPFLTLLALHVEEGAVELLPPLPEDRAAV